MIGDFFLMRRIDACIIALVLSIVVAFITLYLINSMSALNLAVVALFSGVGAFLVAIRIKRRLIKVGDALEDMSAGSLNYRLEVTGGDAISDLARSFNATASSMEQGLLELRQERNRIRSIQQGNTDGIIVFDRLGRVISANPAAEVAIGRLERDIVGTWDIGLPDIEKIVTASDLVPEGDKVRCREAKACTHPECPSYVSQDFRCWLQCGTYCHNEIQGTFSEKRDACERCDVYQKNGIAGLAIKVNNASYAVKISPILNQQGHEEGRIALLNDITEISDARKELLQKYDELEMLNEAAMALSGSLGEIDDVLERTLEIVIKSVSTAAAAILQINPETGVAKRFWSQGLPPQVAVILQMAAVDVDGAALALSNNEFPAPEIMFRHPRGLMAALEKAGMTPVVAVPLCHRGSIHGVMMLAGGRCRDLPASEANLINTVAASIGTAIQNQDLFESATRTKQAWEATFDSMGDAVSFHDTEYNIVRVNAALARYTEKRPAELIGRKCYEVVHGLEGPPTACAAQEVIRTGHSVSIEIAEECLGRTFRITINPVRDSQDAIIGIVHVMKDITESKLLREQLLQSEKMAAVGQLVSGVAHELNNPLTGVLGFSQLLMRKMDDGVKEMIGSEVEAIANEAQRASRIVQNLLSFARKHKSQKTMVDINDAIRTVTDLRSYDLNVRNIKIEAQPSPDIPRTMADLHQIEQVLLNMVNNAEHAIAETKEPGTIGISSRAIDGVIEVAVNDDGIGIPPKTIHRIFDPFFTTKEVGQGTGLGLSICYGIMEEHGGEIRVESHPVAGTTFTMVLPVTESAVQGLHPAMDTNNVSDDGRRRILLVDDEPAIVDLLSDILTMEGHGVDVARNGKLALKKLGSFHYDNVITDIKMPEMDGKELHRRITEIDPQLAANVIFITGDAVSRNTREFLNATGNIFITKPFNIHELRERLSKVMSGYG